MEVSHREVVKEEILQGKILNGKERRMFDKNEKEWKEKLQKNEDICKAAIHYFKELEEEQKEQYLVNR